MAMTFSADRIFAQMAPRIQAAVTDTIRAIEAEAISRAPVRKVFRGGRGRATLQSSEEVAAEAAVRSSLGLAPGAVRTQRTPAARVHGFGPRRLLVKPTFDPRVRRFRGSSGRFTPPATNRLLFNTPLTSRGRFELRSGRANVFSNGQATLGGRLRNEITSEPATGEVIFVGRVISPTPYAKYVEFGTRHARAQPYLRPAVASQRNAFRERLTRALR